MRNLHAVLILAATVIYLAAPPAAGADAPVWTLVPEKSRITFTGRQMRAPSTGEFRTFSADIRFDPDNLEGSKVTVTVDTASAAAGNSQIDTELKKELWFEVDKYPKATFEVTRFVAKGGNDYEAVARLTLRDQTKEVTLPFTLEIAGKRAKASGELKINRLDFGVGRGEWKDTSIVANEVVIRIEVEATRE